MENFVITKIHLFMTPQPLLVLQIMVESLSQGHIENEMLVLTRRCLQNINVHYVRAYQILKPNLLQSNRYDLC